MAAEQEIAAAAGAPAWIDWGVFISIVGLALAVINYFWPWESTGSRRDKLNEAELYRQRAAEALTRRDFGHVYRQALRRALILAWRVYGRRNGPLALGVSLWLALVYSWLLFWLIWGLFGPDEAQVAGVVFFSTSQENRAWQGPLLGALPVFLAFVAWVGVSRFRRWENQWIGEWPVGQRRACGVALGIFAGVAVLTIQVAVAGWSDAVSVGAYLSGTAVLGVAATVRLNPSRRRPWLAVGLAIPTSAIAVASAFAVAAAVVGSFLSAGPFGIVALAGIVVVCAMVSVTTATVVGALTTVIVVAIPVAIGGQLAVVSVLAIALALADSAAIAAAVAVVGPVAIAIAATVVVAFSFSGAGTVAFAVAGSVAIASAIAAAGHSRTGMFQPLSIRLFGAAGIMLVWGGLAVFRVSDEGSVAEGCFLLLLPLANGFADWGSWWVSRKLGSELRNHLRRPHSGREFAALLVRHGLYDLGLALGFFALLAILLAFAFETVDLLATFKDIDVTQTIADAAEHPFADGLWLTAMLLSTLLPTAFHLLFLVASPLALFNRDRDDRETWARALQPDLFATLTEEQKFTLTTEVAEWQAKRHPARWAVAGMLTLGLFALAAWLIHLIATLATGEDRGFADLVAWIAGFGVWLARLLF